MSGLARARHPAANHPPACPVLVPWPGALSRITLSGFWRRRHCVRSDRTTHPPSLLCYQQHHYHHPSSQSFFHHPPSPTPSSFYPSFSCLSDDLHSPARLVLRPAITETALALLGLYCHLSRVALTAEPAASLRAALQKLEFFSPCAVARSQELSRFPGDHLRRVLRPLQRLRRRLRLRFFATAFDLQSRRRRIGRASIHQDLHLCAEDPSHSALAHVPGS